MCGILFSLLGEETAVSAPYTRLWQSLAQANSLRGSSPLSRLKIASRPARRLQVQTHRAPMLHALRTFTAILYCCVSSHLSSDCEANIPWFSLIFTTEMFCVGMVK